MNRQVYPSVIVPGREGNWFFVRVVPAGQPVEQGHVVEYDAIEFFDYDYADVKSFGPRGQFVTRYEADTILGRRGALCLYGGVPKWTVPGRSMAVVTNLLQEFA